MKETTRKKEREKTAEREKTVERKGEGLGFSDFFFFSFYFSPIYSVAILSLIGSWFILFIPKLK